MFALIIGFSILAASLLGWYGHKVYIHIQAWGEKMNEQDAIFQSVASAEEMAATPVTAKISFSAATPFSNDLLQVSMQNQAKIRTVSRTEPVHASWH